MKVVGGGPFLDFVEIWLNNLLGCVGFGVRCNDCHIISICSEFYTFWWEWDVRGVNVEEGRRQNSTLWYSSVDAFEFRVSVVVLSTCLSSFDVICYEFYDCIWDIC